jgi:hypothetical protein
MKAKALYTTTLLVLALALCVSPAWAGTSVPGHQRDSWDKDDNGIPDEGVTVVGHYTALYAYDMLDDWYWDLGDGRIQGTVGSVEELDQETLTTCNYVNNYRAKFENTPYMDSGWIQNHILCSGYDDNNEYNYLIVHETDPRYVGNPDWAIWGTWEYHALTISGFGNLVRPITHAGE